jgi:phage-related protein (TIGR01555 family)
MGKLLMKKKKLSSDVKATMSYDSYANFMQRVGIGTNNTLSQSQYIINNISNNSRQLEAQYRGSWIVGAVVDSIADDMCRSGITIHSAEAADKIDDLQAAITNLRIWDGIADIIRWGRLYGGAIGVLQIDGQDLATPLDYNTITKGQFKGIAVYDRWQLQPDLTNLIKDGYDIGLPAYYRIITSQDYYRTGSQDAKMAGSINVHYSRIIRQIGIQLPFFQAMTQELWGASVIERLSDRLVSFDNATMNAANLVDKARTSVVRVEGLRDVISAGGKPAENMMSSFETMRYWQSNAGLTILDKSDEYQTVSYGFSGLSDIILQFGQQISGACGIPLVRLFGQSPAGLNSSGDSDIRNYYDHINSLQNANLRTCITKLLNVIYPSTFGEQAPEDLQFDFTPLWQMSALDKATIAKTTTESIIGALDSGVIDTATAMKELRRASRDTGLFTNISDKQIAQAEEELPMPDAEVSVEEQAVIKDSFTTGSTKRKFNIVPKWLKK